MVFILCSIEWCEHVKEKLKNRLEYKITNQQDGQMDFVVYVND